MTFEKWWYEIGSGLTPHANEDGEAHARRVAKLAVEAEREECARICDQYQFEMPYETGGGGVCADAIRMRSNN